MSPNPFATTGNDTLRSDDTGGYFEVIDGLAGDDRISGRENGDTLIGGDGNDVIDGGDGDDLIWGDGDDWGSPFSGDDTLFGGKGFDQIFGGNGNDQIHGDEGGDHLYGIDGDDEMYGDAGDDYMRGGSGLDFMYGNSGNDALYGDADRDNLYGEDGDDTLDGGRGNDELVGGIGADFFDHEGIGDQVTEFQNGGVDIVLDYSYADGDVVRGNSFSFVGGDTHVFDDRGNLIFVLSDYNPADGIRLRTFGAGEPTANADPVAADDAFVTDQAVSVAGNVLADNGFGVDSDPNGDPLSVIAASFVTSNGGTVALLADGSFSYAPLAGFVGADSFDYTLEDGEGGSDTGTVTITVEAVATNNDPVAADDIFTVTSGYSFSGNVLADNGNGADSDPDGDTLSVVAADTPTDSDAYFELAADGSFYIDLGETGDYTGTITVDYTLLDGQGGSDTGTVTIEITEFDPTAFGTPGDDSMTGTSADDTMDGLAGNDTIIGLDGADTIWGGEGDDLIWGDADDWGSATGGNDILLGGGGFDRIFGGEGADIIRGGEGGDHLYGINGDDLLFGDEGDDYMRGGSGGDHMQGGAGNDGLYGDGDRDDLYGEDGDDILDGGRGIDNLEGGAGADFFDHEGIGDQVTDFRNGGVDWIVDYSFAEGDTVRGDSYAVIGFDTHVFDDQGNLIFDISGYDADADGIALVPFATS